MAPSAELVIYATPSGQTGVPGVIHVQWPACRQVHLLAFESTHQHPADKRPWSHASS